MSYKLGIRPGALLRITGAAQELKVVDTIPSTLGLWLYVVNGHIPERKLEAAAGALLFLDGIESALVFLGISCVPS